MAEHEQESRSQKAPRKPGADRPPSAAPLPKQAPGDRSASAKPKILPPGVAPPPKQPGVGGADVETATRVEVIRASLQTAWYLLDQGAASLRAKRVLSEQRPIIARTAEEVLPRFREARGAVIGGGREFDNSLVHNEVEFAGRALREFRDATLPDKYATDPEMYAEYFRLRQRVGIRGKMPEAPHVVAKKPAGLGRSIDAVLELARLEATRAFDELVRSARDDSRHLQKIDLLTDSLSHHLEHASFLLGTDEGKKLAGAAQAKIDAVSASILKIDRWIDGRQDNFALARKFARVIAEANQLRATVQLGWIGMLDAPRMPHGVVQQEGDDAREILEAKEQLDSALRTAFVGYREGAERFIKFAELKRPPPETPMWEALAKGILIACLTNLAGPGMVFLFQRATNGRVSEGILGYIGGSTTDSAQATVGPIADAAIRVAASQSENQAVRSRQLFKEGMILAQSKLYEAISARVATGIRYKTISAAAIRELAAGLSKVQASLTDLTYRECAHGFAQLTAQSTLQVQTRGDTQVSNLDGYFGRNRGPYFEGAGSKRGTAGVGRLTLTVHGRGSEKPSLQIGRFELVGMSDDLAIAVLKRAEHQLGQLGLPLEIELQPQLLTGLNSRNFYPQPLMVIDEMGTVRDAVGWDALKYTPDSPNMEGFPEYIYRPELVWESIRGLPLSENTARIEKGG